MVEGDVVTSIDSAFNFSARPYQPLRRRTQEQAAVAYGRAVVLHASAADLERVASWLSQPAIHHPLAMRHAPSKRDVCRSQLPDGSGNMESVEFLMLYDLEDSGIDGKWSPGWRNTLTRAAGFYVIYEARRARGQEVDFAFSPRYAGMGNPVSVSLLRAGRIAVLGYLLAVCGAQRVQWVRRRRIPGTSRYRTQGPTRVVSVAQYALSLGRIETCSEVPSIIEHQ